MKKVISFFLIILLGLFVGMALGCFFQKKKPHRVINTITFRYAGMKGKKINFKKVDGLYLEDSTVLDMENGIIKDPLTAAKISEIVFRQYDSSKYFFPLSISSYDDITWHSSTVSPSEYGAVGGNSHLVFLKKNCMITDYYGTK